MRPDWIDRLWSSSAEGDRLRKRAAAGAALAVLVSGLLIAVGLVLVVIVFWLVVFAVAVVATVIAALGSRRQDLGAQAAVRLPRAHSAGHRTREGVLRLSRRVGAGLRTGAGQAWVFSGAVTRRVRARAPAVAGRSAVAGSRAGEWIASTSRAGTTRARVLTEQVKRGAASRVPTNSSARMREALQLNAEGTRRRRRESYDEAVDLHEQALAILREVGDQRAVALTLNNLALAMSHTDGDRTAIVLFEEAASILHELGDEEHEGRVIANLGLTHRRHGRREQSDNVLQLALTKLAPTSPEYQTVEAELRRAS